MASSRWGASAEVAMAECIKFGECSYCAENLARMPLTAKMVEYNYCHNLVEECARYKLFKSLGDAFVPRDLPPSDTDRAEDIIRNACL